MRRSVFTYFSGRVIFVRHLTSFLQVIEDSRQGRIYLTVCGAMNEGNKMKGLFAIVGNSLGQKKNQDISKKAGPVSGSGLSGKAAGGI